MVDRIEKISKTDYWKISETHETKEEKKRDERRGKNQESRDSFGETSDFIQLLTKDPRKYKTEKIDSSQIQKFFFRGISTHREKAILEVDITLMGGHLIQGAQVALNRPEGMKFISRKPGEEIVVDQIVKGTFLTVALPQKVEGEQKAERPSPPSAETVALKSGIAWYYYLGLIIVLLTAGVLIYVFLKT